MAYRDNPNSHFRFGVFELDLAARELRKGGMRIKLQDQPFQVLALLLERPGEIVTREELREALWSEDTFVEFDSSLNTAVQKIRRALGDSATSPRFVETIPRHGYRFVAPTQDARPTNEIDEKASADTKLSRFDWRNVLVACAAGFAFSAALVFWGTGRFKETPAPPLSAVPLTTYPGTETSPSFSPDGNQVAFSWDGPGEDNFDIYVKVVGPGEPLRLTSDPDRDSSPAWSPDGRFIAFVRWQQPSPRGEVMLVPALGGAERKVGTTIFHPLTVFLPCLAWSADSKWLALPDADSPGKPVSLFLLSSETGEKRRLTTARDSVDYYPAFSPDGRTLAFTRNNRDVHALALSEGLAPLGEPRPLTPYKGGLAIIGPTWTADGREIVYSRGRSLFRVRTLGAGESQPTPMSAGAASWLAISPLGNRLVFSRPFADSNIWGVELTDEDNAPIKPSRFIASTHGDAGMDYSPDGKRIVFGSTRSGSQEIWMANSDGSNPVQLTFFPEFAVGSPRWSPDGTWIAFDSTAEGAGDIFLVSAQGGKPRRFTEHGAYDALPSWSRDGRWIYFYSTRNGTMQIWKKAIEGGEAIQVTKDGGTQAFESADGKLLYFVKRDEPGLWKTPVEGGEQAFALEGVQSHRFYVNGDGVYFYFVEDSNRPETGSIRVHSFATGQTRTIVDLDRPLSPGLTVSPDGRWLLYSQVDQTGSDLMLVEGFE